MTRIALAFAALATLCLNGAQASATEPAAPAVCTAQGVCAISLRMMTPPPPRPAHLTARVAAERAEIMALADRG